MKLKNNTYHTLKHWNNFGFDLVIEGIIVGAVTGFIIVLYRVLLEEAGKLVSNLYIYQKTHLWFIPIWALILVGIGVIVGYMVKKEPMISGSGIPQVEGVLLRKFKMDWVRIILGKFFGGLLAIGAGLSLGREGPSVQIGAAAGQGVSRILKRIKIKERFLITSGASAGLAAAFNAPVAGVMFALEEVHKSFSPLVLTSAMAASITADLVARNFFGMSPIFNFRRVTLLPIHYYWLLILLGIIIAFFGKLFNTGILKTLDLYEKRKWLPVEFRPIVPLMVSILLGLFIPAVLGGGNELVMSLVSSSFTIKALLVILIAKFLFTLLCYGSGVPGGIFLPLLVVGALLGNIFGIILLKLHLISSTYMLNFIILAMAGYFTAVVKSPITGTLLITEMTGSFEQLLPLAIVSLTVYAVSDIIKVHPIYEALLERLLAKGTKNEFLADDKTKVIIEVPIRLGSALDNKKVKDYNWPEKCLLVAIKRGDKEIIPKGNTMIFPGDYLTVLTDEVCASQIRDVLSEAGENFCYPNRKI